MRAASAPVRGALAPVRLLDGELKQRARAWTGRRVWRFPGRVHIEVRCAPGPAGVDRAQSIVRALEDHPAVEWARLNAPMRRVIVAVPGEPPMEELLRVVEELDAPDTAAPRPPLGLILGLDMLGLAATGIEWTINRAPLPAEAAGLVSLVDTVPRLSRAVERVVPGMRAERWLPVVGAAVQALSPGATGLAVDVTQRVWQLRESRARNAAWTRAEQTLTGTPERAAADPVVAERPCPLPDGPVERHADQAAVLAPAAGVLGWLATRDPRRGLQTALAAVPKPPVAARELFAADLGIRLARRGVVTADPGVLRRLDRIDTCVLDAAVLLSGAPALGEVVPLEDADPATVAAHLYDLFDPGAPGERVERDGWALGPAPADMNQDLLLTHHGRPQASAAVIRQQADEVNALTVAARRAGLRLVLAGEGPELPGGPDARVPGGDRLAASIRELQADGAAVLVISDHRTALAAADCGAGVTRTNPPWGAHLLLPDDDLEVAVTVIEAIAGARRVSELGVTLARSGSAVAALLALTGPPGRAAGRTLAAVNGAAAVGMMHAAWQARAVTRVPAAPPLPTTRWHAMPAEIVLKRLGGRAGGLTEEEAGQRRPDRPGRRPVRWRLARAVGRELANPLTPVLAAGAAGSAAVGSPADAALVTAAMGLSGLVGGVQRAAADKTLERLSYRSTQYARVLRDGRESAMPADRLVPGDVVALSSGEVVPADCRVLTAHGLETDESSLTGESLPVAKTAAAVIARHVAERRSMLYEGTTVAAGEATAVVVAVGEATESGRAMAATATAAPPSGVETRLKSITNATTPIALGAALGVATSGLVRGNRLRLALSEGVNLAVASVPEGLPLLVSAAQLAATRRLAARGVYVRNPRTIEALGRVDVLCFDKTGTLTEGEIRLDRVADHTHDAPVTELDDPLREVLTAAKRATPRAGNGGHSHLTDAAVDDGAGTAGIRRDWKQIASLPFEPSRAYHATLGRSGDGDGTLICMKGAPEVVLPRCVRTPDGDLDEEGRRKLAERAEKLASSGHRVLAVAQRGARPNRRRLTDGDVADLTFLGLLGLSDAVRETAVPAVTGLREAGVHIVMLTGDHPGTAGAIAAHVHDHDEGTDQHVITGDEIDRLDDEALAEAIASMDVVARCTPAHKVRVVQAFQRLGRTVAMTGDGANDAAGIRLADVGIALGGRGTAAAQSAADLVVADDRLETIVSALAEGRAMWASVREALAILVGGNLGEIGFTLLGALSTGRSPLSTRQLLLMNMLTDLAPALAIAVRAPSGEAAASLLSEGPESSLGTALTEGIAHRAVVTALGATGGWTVGRFTGPAVRARTIGLVALVGTQLAQTVLAGRTDRTILVSAVGSALLLAAIVQTPGVSGFFGCVPLDPLGWATAAGAILAAVTAGRMVPFR